jgi:energy-converting hydrogenase B subunit J
MTFYFGPVVIGFLLGFILGTRIKPSPESKLKFDAEIYVIVLIAAIIVAYYLGPFPYYVDVPLASGFVSAIIGLLMGKLLFGRDKGTKSQID